MQQLISASVDSHGTIKEIYDEICTMTGFRTRFMVFTMKSGKRYIWRMGAA